MAGAPAAPLSSSGAPTKAAACARSSAACSVKSETTTKSPTLKKSDQNTPWLVLSSPVSPRSAVGRSRPRPKGPSSSRETGSMPSRTSAGTISV